MGTLFRSLAEDTKELVGYEISLAKMELKEFVTSAAVDMVKIMIALALASIGGICLIVAMILGLGELLGDAFWLGALISGILLTGTGAVLARLAIRDLQRQSPAPRETIDTLQEDRAWAKDEMQKFKKRLR